MSARNILVVIVDGLRASALGAYGNTTFPTPAFDRFAAESFLLDWCYAPSPELADIYRAMWQTNQLTLPQRFAERSYATTLVTDDPELKSFAGASEFQEVVELARPTDSRAEDMATTSLAHAVSTTADILAKGNEGSPRLVWLHARGMYGPWDAPLDLQRSLLDEGDPPPLEEIAPPDLTIDAAGDPDAAFRYSCAYAAQCMTLDFCWEHLLTAADAEGGDWLVTLLGARGFPLGEHLRIGGVDPRLYGEQLHVPWLIRFADGAGRLARTGQLVSHNDLAPTLLDWFDATPHVTSPSNGGSVYSLARNSMCTWRDAHVATSAGGARAIRTADWCLRLDAAPIDAGALSSTNAELFVRPDDRWESNDVAKLCPDVVEALAHKMREVAPLLSPADSAR